MMQLPLYQVDAFTRHPFAGNPAAVVLCPTMLEPSLMQTIAAENNLSETAFVWPWPNEQAEPLRIRWFTPTVEVSLCGHATLAAAHVLFRLLPPDVDALCFYSERDALPVSKVEDGRLCLHFPEDSWQECAAPEALRAGLQAEPLECYRGRDDYLAVFASEDDIRRMQPDMPQLARVDARAVIVSAVADAGRDYDVVSRFFAPQSGIAEDPVTGSAHTTLAPFWSARLGINPIRAQQLSARGGELWCRHAPPLVEISGHAVTVLSGHIHLPQTFTP